MVRRSPSSVRIRSASSVWVCRLDTLVPTQVPNTENAFRLFWSPDSKQIAFFADGKLKTVALAGGVVRVVRRARSAWRELGNQGTIVLAPAATDAVRGERDGGELSVAVELDSTKKENSLRYPAFLPDGEHLLFVALPRRQSSRSAWPSSGPSRTTK